MSDVAKSTVAQLLFSTPPALNFAHAVAVLDAVLAHCPADSRTLSWDADDVAVFDLDGSRIVIGYADGLIGPHSACLTLSVGHGTRIKATAALAQRRDALCRSLADRLTARYPVDSVIVQETDSPVTAERIEALLDALPRGAALLPPMKDVADVDRLMARMSVELETRVSQPVPNFVPPEKPSFTPMSVRPLAARTVAPAQPPAPEPAAEPAANDTPALPRPRDAELERIRAALYPVEPVEVEKAPTTQMRLAVHALNATMIVVYLPLGAAAMTYSLLRGEDMRLSGRLMALMGTALALSQTHFAQQVIALV